MELHKRDPFCALCVLASREDWCWKICCTTCGHMYFRYSFKELIAGKHPDDSSWIVRQENHHVLNSLGPMPSLSGWSLEEQRSLAQILVHTDIGAVHQACRFPDWLGYLGLALAYTEDAEWKDRTITPAMVPRLVALVSGNPSCSCFLEELLSAKDRHLRWRDLKTVESAIRSSRTKQ